ARLLSPAGLLLRKRHAGQAWLGDIGLESRGSARIASLVAPTWPLYPAGVDQDDELKEIDGRRIVGENDVASVLERHRPGESVTIPFVDRTGSSKTAAIRLAENPHLEIVPVESSGSLTPAQRSFRDRWMKPRG